MFRPRRTAPPLALVALIILVALVAAIPAAAAAKRRPRKPDSSTLKCLRPLSYRVTLPFGNVSLTVRGYGHWHFSCAKKGATPAGGALRMDIFSPADGRWTGTFQEAAEGVPRWRLADSDTGRNVTLIGEPRARVVRPAPGLTGPLMWERRRVRIADGKGALGAHWAVRRNTTSGPLPTVCASKSSTMVPVTATWDFVKC